MSNRELRYTTGARCYANIVIVSFRLSSCMSYKYKILPKLELDRDAWKQPHPLNGLLEATRDPSPYIAPLITVAANSAWVNL